MTRYLPVRRYTTLFCAALLLLSGCASTGGLAQETQDPYENYNRAMFKFNDKVDKNIIKPIAKGYKKITPEFVDIGISNFFGNLGDISVIVNDLLQLELDQAVNDTGRVLINSTFGLLGFIDIATPMGMPKHDEDFGQTLAHWGVGEGHYLVLPILGPSTTRDMWSVPLDTYLLNPAAYVDPLAASYGLYALDAVDIRADLLRAERAFGDAALDPYTFQREAYLQRRRNLIYGDEAPRPSFDDFEGDAAAEPIPNSDEQ